MALLTISNKLRDSSGMLEENLDIKNLEINIHKLF